jgi:hypothetical protein
VILFAVVAPDPVGVTSSNTAVSQSLALDLTQGPLADLCNQTTSIALKLFVVFGLIALGVEAFGHSPEQRRDFVGVAWRAVVVLMLLKFYAPIFGSVIATTQSLADQFKPMEANEELSAQTAQYFSQAQQLAMPTTTDPTATLPPEPSWIGTKVYEATIHLIITLGQAVFWAFSILARIALLLFYVVGPLALVASLPRASRVGTRWFGHYVGVACWPILGAIVIRIVLAIGVSGLYASSAFGHVCVALALGFCALAVPVVASALVGGNVTTATQHGFGVAQKHVGGLTSTMSRAMKPDRAGQDGRPQSGASGQQANSSGSPATSRRKP